VGSLATDKAESGPAYMKTQIEYIRSDKVLTAALRNEKVKNLNIVREETNPINWLKKKLLLEYLNGSEALQIALVGSDPQELAVLVNGIKDAYMVEVVEAEKRAKTGREKLLSDTLEKYQNMLKERRKTLQVLASDIGSTD